jgi:hypothetical protein
VSILQLIKEKQKKQWTDAQIMAQYDSSNSDNSRVTVIADHNSRAYQVDGLLMGRDLDNIDLTFNHEAKKAG